MKKILILLGVLSLTFTLSTAQDMRCQAGKCGSADKQDINKKCADGKADENKSMMKCQAGKCGGTEKKALEKGKCGQGKCG